MVKIFSDLFGINFKFDLGEISAGAPRHVRPGDGFPGRAFPSFLVSTP
jgi:hypothetical protein